MQGRGYRGYWSGVQGISALKASGGRGKVEVGHTRRLAHRINRLKGSGDAKLKDAGFAANGRGSRDGGTMKKKKRLEGKREQGKEQVAGEAGSEEILGVQGTGCRCNSGWQGSAAFRRGVVWK